jgi:hypothetical protein
MPKDRTRFYLIVRANLLLVIDWINSIFFAKVACLEHRYVFVLAAFRANLTQNGTGVADAIVAKENSV